MQSAKVDNLPTFLIAITILTITPGVDTVLVIRNTSRGGVVDGWVTSVAICSGLFVHASLSAIGISLILLQSAWLFLCLKYIGAAYLIWLGASSLRQAVAGTRLQVVETEAGAFQILRSAREGLLSNLLNPKTIIFYMALLPQFIDPTANALLQSLGLAGIHFVLSVFWLGLVALLAHQMAQLITAGTFKQWLDSVLGLTLVGFGIGLANQTYRQG